MLQLKQQYREQILSDVVLQAKIAQASKRTIETVKRLARNNNELLTLETVTKTIKDHLNLQDGDIITEEVPEPVTV